MTATSPTAEIQLLNRFAVTGGPPAISRPAQRLLAFLAVNDGAVSREFAAFSLWPETSEARAAASLRTAVWSLRASPEPLIRVAGTSVALAPGVSVDYRHLRVLGRNLAASTDATLAATQTTAFAGDLLPDWYEDWLIATRERWKEIRLQALDAIAQRSLADGGFLAAIEAALTAIAVEPLRETTRYLLVQAHLAQGNRGQAVAEYRTFRRYLHEELGVDPSPDLQALIARAGLTA